jgi:hypothetical protein
MRLNGVEPEPRVGAWLPRADSIALGDPRRPPVSLGGKGRLRGEALCRHSRVNSHTPGEPFRLLRCPWRRYQHYSFRVVPVTMQDTHSARVRQSPRRDRAARLCGARDAVELERSLTVFALAMFGGPRVRHRDAVLTDRLLTLRSVADTCVNGYRCPAHRGPCECGDLGPDQLAELNVTEEDLSVASDLLPVLDRFWWHARREANRLTGGRGERRHRRRLRKSRSRSRPQWVPRTKPRARSRGRHGSGGAPARSTRRGSCGSSASGGDPPDGGDPEPAQVLAGNSVVWCVLARLAVVALCAMVSFVGSEEISSEANFAEPTVEQDIMKMYRQLAAADRHSPEYSTILKAIAVASAQRGAEQSTAREEALQVLGGDALEIDALAEDATGWFDADSVEFSDDPFDYQQIYEDAVWAAVEVRLGEAGFDLSIPAIWDSAWESCRWALESPGDPRESRPWVGALHDGARQREACERRVLVGPRSVRARRFRSAQARRSRGRAVRRRGSRRVVRASSGGGSSGDPPGESDSDEPALGRRSTKAVLL